MIPRSATAAGLLFFAVASTHLHGNVNFPTDTDGNGLFDSATVADWDGDGLLETEDIQAAIDSLDDPGLKRVQIGPGLFAGPPPESGTILRLPSNLVLSGNGAGTTILRGYGAGDLVSTGAVISNADHAAGNRNITVRYLEIDGGWRGGDATGFGNARMGVYFNGCKNCRAEFLTVRDTLHSCLYSKNGQDVYFSSNSLQRCGNYTGAGYVYPCVYLFVDPGETQRDVFVLNNSCDGSGAAALNTRRADTAGTLESIHFIGNRVQNTRADPYAQPCISFAGVDGGSFRSNVCVNTGPLFYFADSYYVDGTDTAAARNIVVDGLQMISPIPSAHGIEIHGYLENATFRNVAVTSVGAGRHCLVYDNPLKNVRFDGWTLTDCGDVGIEEALPRGTGPDPDDGLVFSNITIDGNDVDRSDNRVHPGIRFRGPARDLLIQNLDLRDVSGDGMEFLGDVAESIVRDSAVRSVGGSAIALADGVSVDRFEIRDNVFEQTGLDGIRLPLSFSAPSRSLAITGNTVRDCCAADAGAASIALSGAVGPVEVAENRLEDVAGRAAYGVVHDVSPPLADTSYLCSNEFSGTFVSGNRYLVTGDLQSYRDDADADDSVDGCDCAPADPTIHPRAAEVNDVIDNNCPGDVGFGVVDETSGNSGFTDPLSDASYTWSAQGGATLYEVARSGDPSFAGPCRSLTVSGTSWTDLETPGADHVFFYINRPASPSRGSWGQNSAGAERSHVCLRATTYRARGGGTSSKRRGISRP